MIIFLNTINQFFVMETQYVFSETGIGFLKTD
jgi:hypothetical protein